MSWLSLAGWRRVPPSLPEAPVARVLLASEGRAFAPAAIDRVAALAAPGAVVRVLSIARIWGVSLGFPNPFLLPSRHEWEAQRAHVDRAIAALKKRGLRAEGHVIGTRDAARRIVAEGKRIVADVIVMGADPPPSRWLGNVLWSQEPYRVRTRAAIPVALEVTSAK